MKDLRELLVCGRIIEVRNGDKYLICGKGYYLGYDGWIDPPYDEALQADVGGEWDIIKIYHPVHYNLKKALDDLEAAKAIWSRPKERPRNLKDTLQTGMRVTTRDGDTYIVLRGQLETNGYGVQEVILMNPDNFLIGSRYNNSLQHEVSNSCDIIKIERVFSSSLAAMLTRAAWEVVYEEE